jgi:hypothetical protein
MERDFLEAQLAEGRSLEHIGALVGRDPSTVSYWLKKHGLVAANHQRHAPKGGVDPGVLETLVEKGLTRAEIATELGIGASTVNYWLKKFDLRTVRARQGSPGDGPLPKYTRRVCLQHGEARFILEGRGYYRCTRCRMERVADRRRVVKQILVSEAGSRCVLCGYDRHLGALHFHHLDPREKSFGIARNGHTRGIAEARAEVSKCVLVCANCHAELEAGLATLQDRAQASDVAQSVEHDPG